MRQQKQNLEETKQILEACKKECQKLFYEHEAFLKKQQQQQQWIRTKKKSENTKANKETEKKKNYVVNEHDNYESNKKKW